MAVVMEDSKGNSVLTRTTVSRIPRV